MKIIDMLKMGATQDAENIAAQKDYEAIDRMDEATKKEYEYNVNNKRSYQDSKTVDLMNTKWDYQNPQKLGMQGEPLPPSAVSWKPDGTPYFGSGITGWFKETAWNIYKPSAGYDVSEPIAAFEVIPNSAIEGEQLDLFKTIGNLWDRLIRWTPETGLPSVGEMASRLVGEALGTGLSVLGGVAEEFEKLNWGVGKGYEEAGKGSVLPELNIKTEWLDRFANGTPLVGAYNMLRTLTSPIPWTDKANILKANYEAGRIAYTGFFYPAKQNEMVQRYIAGENPLFLEMELENPWIEMGGEIIFDPLNLIDLVGGPVRLASKMDDMRGLLYNLPDLVDNVLRVGAENLDDVAAVARYTELSTEMVQDNIKFAQGMTDYARKLALDVSTYSGKQHKLGRTVGTVIDHVLITFQDEPDKALDIFKALAKAAGSDLDEVADGMLGVGKYKNARILWSEAGRETGYMLRQLIGETAEGKLAKGEKLLNIIEDAGGDLPKLAEGLRQVASKVIDNLYPSLTKRISMYDEAVKLKAAGKVLTEAQEFALTDKISDGMRFLDKYHNIAQKLFYKPAITAQSAAYMGLSGGYPFRNVMVDGITTTVDYGVGVFKHTPESWAEIGTKWLGGLPNVGLKEGIGSFGAQISKGIESVSDMVSKLPGIQLAQWFERKTSSVISGFTVDKWMRKGLKYLPGSDVLREAGLDNKGIVLLKDALIKSHGNVDEAADILREALKTGTIESNKTIAWLGDKVIDDLHSIESMDKNVLDAVVGAVNKDDALLRAKTSFAELRSIADNLPHEAVTVTDKFIGVDEVADLGAAVSKGAVNSDVYKLATNKFVANDNAINGFNTAINNLKKGITAETDELARTGKMALEKVQEIQATLNRITIEVIQKANEMLNVEVKVAADFKVKYLDEWYNPLVADLVRKDPVDIKLFEKLQREFDLVDVPIPLTNGELKSIWWEQCFSKWMDAHYIGAREQYVTVIKSAENIMLGLYKPVEGGTEYFNTAQKMLDEARKWDDTLRPMIMRFEKNRALKIGDNIGYARAAAKELNIELKAGENLDQKILDIVNDYKKSKTPFTELRQVPPKLTNSALKEYKIGAKVAEVAPEAGKGAGAVEDVGEGLGKLPVPYDGGVPTRARIISESAKKIDELEQIVLRGIESNFDSVYKVAGNAKIDAALKEWAKVADPAVGELRYMASRGADAARDFSLHAYPEKIGADLVASYIYPYQFWYSRTYTKWLKRLTTNPGTIAAYSIYRDKMSSIHAGAPEWWKYNVNTNELFGMDAENPLYFNFEATLNPLYGLTGVDFNDKYKRINWWTAAIDDMNKFGPSIWTPYTMAVAMILKMQGEEDASARWGGRLIPATGALKSLTALMNIGPAGGLEVDPNIWLFSNGIDPYERNRIGRALGWLVEKGEITSTEAIDAAYSQKGEIWDMAHEWAAKQRAPGQLASFLFGVGFKGRNATDLQIDQFYSEYYRLLNMRPLMTPDEVNKAWSDLRVKYPFMDSVLLAKKPAGADRDTAMAYNVLSRIPPGQKDNLFELFGVSYDTVQAFYDSKGAMETWSESERLRFMGAILEMSSVISIPDEATRNSYIKATTAYGKMMDEMKKQYGDTIDLKINEFYRLLDTNREAADQYLIDNPEVQEAMSYKNGVIINDPYLKTYYASVDMIENYYEGQMYDEIRKECGANMSLVWDEYNQAKLDGWGSKYWKEHPELKKYMDIQEKYRAYIYEVISITANSLNEIPWGEIRTGEGAGSEALQKYIEQPRELGLYGYTKQDWQGMMSPALWNLLQDKIYLGEYLSEAAESQLDYIANKYDISVNKLLAIIEAAQ